MRIKRFVVTGSIEVQGQQVKDADGCVCGYKQKDGSTVKLVKLLFVLVLCGLIASCTIQVKSEAPGIMTRVTSNMAHGPSVFLLEFEGHRYLCPYSGGIIEVK